MATGWCARAKERDTHPLALELAAARLRTLSLADLAAALSGRYRMLETIREYGLERPAEQGTLTGVRDLAARVGSQISRHNLSFDGTAVALTPSS
ncbi:hypothetical protein ACIRQP_02615 [Streptomyces sp. NPDC102274]|uniref:hypothetical protein n=1 Tax=Streptomyces sp. NPDC102274 TaxID=3366151 RepID=UPI003818639C